MHQNPNDLRRGDPTVRDAIRFGAIVAVLGLGFLIVASVWVGTCGGSTTGTMACGTSQRTMLAMGSPVILLIGGVRAFVRTYQNWRANLTWVPWQGAGWFLLSMMLIVLTTSLGPLVGPTLP